MNGVLGSRNLIPNVPQAIYVCARDQASIVTVNLVNRNHLASVQVSVAVTDNALNAPAITDWIEYEVTLKPQGVLSRTGLMISPDQYLVVLSNSNKVNAICWGVEIGEEITVDPITVNLGPTPTWVTPAGTTTVGTGSATVAFSATVTGPGITYSVASGTLPPGTVLNTTTGEVTNFSTAVAAGPATYTFTLRATTDYGATADRTFTIQITAVTITPTQRAIFGFGITSAASATNITNLVSSTGVVATDTTGVGQSRSRLAAATYGGDRAIFGFGVFSSELSMTNLVSNTGVVATDTAGVGQNRGFLAAAGYGGDRAIFGYGFSGSSVSTTNLVSNTGVVATNTTGVGTARGSLAATTYADDRAIFGYGTTGVQQNITNLVSNTGVVSTDTAGVGTARNSLAAAPYGSAGRALFGYGATASGSGFVSVTNLITNTGVVASDTTGVGTARNELAAARYGGDRALFGYGLNGGTFSSVVSITNLVSNIGVVATDTTGVGTARCGLAAAGYSTSASPTSTNTQRAIFGYGTTDGSSSFSVTNLVSSTGVVAGDTTGVGTTRYGLAAAGYGNDRAIFGYGLATPSFNGTNVTNLVSNTGVVSTDTSGVGTARYFLAAATYGNDRAIFGYGATPLGLQGMTNLVSNTGVVSGDTAAVGTIRQTLAAAGYGGDRAIFGYGTTGSTVNISNLVSNTGVVATDTAGVGTARQGLAAAMYSTDRAIFGYGFTGSVNVSMTNLVSNTGVISTDTTGVGSIRRSLAAALYGADRAIFGYGTINGSTGLSMTNLVSNTGVVATDTAGVGTARQGLAAAGYSST